MKSELEDIETKIKGYEKGGWIVTELKDDAESRYHIESPTGDVFESYYLESNICQFCADDEEYNQALPDDEEDESEEEKWCDGSMHDPELMRKQEQAEKLLELVLRREEIKFSRELGVID